MKFLFGFVLILLVGTLKAQNLQGVILDANTKNPVAYATVSSNNKTTLTNLTGHFNLPNMIIGDTITVSFIGYKTYKIGLAGTLKTLTIYLEPGNILLNPVAIRATRNFKADSLLNRHWYDTVFKYKPPGIKDIFITRSRYAKSDRPNNTTELVSIDALQVINVLFKSNNPTTRLQKVLLKDEEENYVDMVFTKGRVVAITALKGDSLKEFMIQYRPSANEARGMTGYDMWAYIKKSYRQFKKEGDTKIK